VWKKGGSWETVEREDREGCPLINRQMNFAPFHASRGTARGLAVTQTCTRQSALGVPQPVVPEIHCQALECERISNLKSRVMIVHYSHKYREAKSSKYRDQKTPCDILAVARDILEVQ